MQNRATAFQVKAQYRANTAGEEVVLSYVRQSIRWNTGGVVLAFLGTCFWLTTAKLWKPLLHSVPLLLLAVYVLLCLLLI
jgi:hypothetical protein